MGADASSGRSRTVGASDSDWDRAVVHALSARDALEQCKADEPEPEPTGMTLPPAPDPPTDPAPASFPQVHDHPAQTEEGPGGGDEDALVSPQDAMALQRGMLRIARVVQGQERSLRSVTAQLAQVESWLGKGDPSGADVSHRIEALDTRLQRLEPLTTSVELLRRVVAELATRDRAQEEDDAAQAEAGAAEAAGTEELEQLGRQVAVAAERTVALDDRLSRLESLRQDVSAVAERSTELEDRLARLEEVREIDAVADDRLNAVETRIERLEQLTCKVALAEERLSRLEALPATLDALVEEKLERSASDLLSLPGDVEGLYKELDTVAERVAARDATVLAHLDRIAQLDVSVKRLREDVGQVIAGLAEVRKPTSAPEVCKRIEQRLDALESPNAEVERLYRALRRLVAAEPDGEFGGDGSAALPSSPKAVQSLSAELHPIQRSLEVLPIEEAGGSG